MRVLLFFSIFFVSILSLYKQSAQKQTILISPQTTIFAFDLHGVVLIPDYSQIASIIWYKFPKVTFIKFLVHPSGLYTVWQLIKSKEITENVFDDFCRRYPQFGVLKQPLIELIAAQRLDTKVVETLLYLKQKGYQRFILSNIWLSALKLLVQRYPVLLELFSGVYIPSPENQYAHKPELRFYCCFKNYLKRRAIQPDISIFIDNNSKNRESANKAGLHALQLNSVDALIALIKDKK